ncbi:5-oxoprolinase [Advenella kashmirensis W13003]|uniref:5-oxoprolinase n=1 Tax=Advenella kashmirensis W13003 TaxID=1424334 RepID=V8QYE2_9BURK|nr:hydantoinase B/oxoprolinase family protein [Advenella kashmirensis]ETF04403.1 5-oxoprolinase [Advenella kashmirensis W13003]
MSKWQFWVDRGGTFTDIVAITPEKTLLTRKLLSENPEHYEDAAIEGIRDLLQAPAGKPIPVEQIDCVKMGTTVATNALLERKGERVVFLTTRGFAHALRIAYQNRPRLFDRHIVLPEMLYERVLETDERMDAAGEVVTPVDEHALKLQLQSAYDAGLRSIAIVFMHAWRNPAHEKAAAQLARQIGFTQISASHEVNPLIKFVSRGDTTVVDAYLSPILRRYVDQVAAQLPDVNLMFMQSSGGLSDAHRFRGKDAILSGPAGGIVGMARSSQQAGFKKVIGFDMGGTSTDVSHFSGVYERDYETSVAGVRMRTPMMRIHTVAAGGGSILHFDGARLRVGPDSAGAHPGPASYRKQGPLTITDCNVMLGKIQPDYFPAVFGPMGDQPLDTQIVADKFRELSQQVSQATGKMLAPEEVAAGFLAIGVQNMAEAIKRISVQQGHDVTRYTLTTFGGAGGQHACLVADALGMTTVFAHPLGGVLSAYGMGLADQVAIRQQTVEKPLTDGLMSELDSLQDDLGRQASAELSTQLTPGSAVTLNTRVQLKYQGTDSALEVDFGSASGMLAAFNEQYQQRYAFLIEDRPLVVESLLVEAVIAGSRIEETVLVRQDERPPQADSQREMYSNGKWHDTPVFKREALQAGDVISGPAIIAEANQTTVVEAGWSVTLNNQDHLILTRTVPLRNAMAVSTDADPVMLEVFNNLFMSIADQMGLSLQNTAYSVNIKERLDFSCAIFDAEGNLIANAPHMPVHLGSMSESIKTVMRENTGNMQPGDAYVVNDPYHGGTHLPDITVITPVFDRDAGQIIFYVGSRGHHADVGGLTPGSMPPDSTTIEEEGVLFTNFQLVRGGRFREREAREILCSGKYPARNPDQNLADLQAQIAANQKGVKELHAMCDTFGLDVVQAYMQHVQDNAEASVRRVIPLLRDGHFTYDLDNGAVIKVAIRIHEDRQSVTVDFTGSSPQLTNNFNAPASIAVAAVLYVFRTLVNDDIPLNAGCLKPINIVIPTASMLNPEPPASVVAGNVETSMCIVNALYGALGVLAASQGTMNNFTFGNARYQYYETISGGTGAGALRLDSDQEGFDGTSLVQAHMTNSRLTDPEVLELRFPVRLESYAIRDGSGGAGKWRGGDGGIRRMRFLEPMTAAILSNNRKYAPFGLKGGEPGKTGRNTIERADGSVTELGPQDSADLQAGDVFVIETPGGGGYGVAE